jgi:hypothetical protein
MSPYLAFRSPSAGGIASTTAVIRRLMEHGYNLPADARPGPHGCGFFFCLRAASNGPPVSQASSVRGYRDLMRPRTSSLTFTPDWSRRLPKICSIIGSGGLGVRNPGIEIAPALGRSPKDPLGPPRSSHSPPVANRPGTFPVGVAWTGVLEDVDKHSLELRDQRTREEDCRISTLAGRAVSRSGLPHLPGPLPSSSPPMLAPKTLEDSHLRAQSSTAVSTRCRNISEEP